MIEIYLLMSAAMFLMWMVCVVTLMCKTTIPPMRETLGIILILLFAALLWPVTLMLAIINWVIEAKEKHCNDDTSRKN